MGAAVLLVDDDAAARALAAQALTMDGFEVAEASTASKARELNSSRRFDLVVLDLGLPDEQGLDWLVELRRVSTIPVVVLTGRSGVEDRVVGLRLGADDYLVKPFAPTELSARVTAVLRRVQPAPVHQTLDFGDLVIDEAAGEVRVAGELVSLTRKEYELLCHLASHPRQVFSREQLLVAVWNSSSEWQHPATVTQHVRRVRQKVEIEAGATPRISTIRGVGYRFDP
ncbi:response regulator transcription factor [Rhabdothermincola sp.]|jgi:DNA-binding response OmpR family regulator|uniref:response regulator transcription factor n=1 Tax=Rhabdothermincola sp. TaxID=2820405 RepID=UPI002FE3B9DA